MNEYFWVGFFGGLGVVVGYLALCFAVVAAIGLLSLGAWIYQLVQERRQDRLRRARQ